MALVIDSDLELAANVEMQKDAVDAQAAEVTAKALELLATTPSEEVLSPEENAKNLATAASGLLYDFEWIGAELAMTSDAAFKQKWDASHQVFRNALQEAVKLAEDSKKYMQSFNDKVVNRFSEGNVNWEQDKELVADFMKDGEGARLREQTAKVSQMFTDIKGALEGFEESYGNQITQKGRVYEDGLKQVDEDRRRVQSKLDSNRASTRQVQSSMRRTTGCLLVRIIRAIVSFLFGRSPVLNAANDRVAELQREEQDLIKERDAIDQRAAGLAAQGSALSQTRHAMSVLVDNMGDMSGRFNTLAQTWADTHYHMVQMDEFLKYASTEQDRDVFIGQMRLTAETTKVLTANVEAFTNGVAPGGVLVKPKKAPSAYDMSGVYGGTDGVAFNDSRPEIDPAMSIASMKIVRKWGIDGLHVTYRLKDGTTRTDKHGVDRNSEFDTVTLAESEYISMISGKHTSSQSYDQIMNVPVLANKAYWDQMFNSGTMPRGVTSGVLCVTMEITDSKTGAKRTVGPFGEGTGSGAAYQAPLFSWKGRLLCFGGVTKAGVTWMGLRGLKCIQLKAEQPK